MALGVTIKVSADTDQAEAGLKRVEAGLKSTDAAAKRTGAGLATGARQLKAYGQAAQVGSHHTANLAAQFNDIGMMLAAGQSPLMLAMQQGTQVSQVFTQMGGTGKQALAGIIGGLRSVVSPMSLLTIGVIAGGAALVQWGMSALDAGDDADVLAEKLTAVRDAQAALNDEIRAFALGASADELVLLDAIAAKRAEIAEMQRRITPQTRIQIAAEKEALQALLDQLDTQRDLQAEKARMLAATNELADAERAIWSEVKNTGDEMARNERIADMLKSGISASVVQAMLLAGVDMASPISTAAMEAATLATNLGIAYGEAVKLNAARNAPYVSSGRGGDPSQFDSENRFSDRYVASPGAVAGAIAMGRTARGGGGGGGGRGGGGGAAMRDPAIEALINSLKTEDEILTEWREEGLTTLAEANAKELEVLGGHAEAKLRLEEEYQRRLSDMRGGYHGDGLAQAQTFFGEMAMAMQGGSEKMLRIAKVFGAAESLVNSYRAYTAVLADPSLPWFARVPAAVSVLSAGLGMVSAIKGVSAGGGTGGGAAAASAGAQAAPMTQNVQIDLIGATAAQVDQYQQFADTLNEAARQGLLTNITVAG